MNEQIINALEDFRAVAEENNLIYDVDVVVDILRQDFSTYGEVMTYLYTEHGVEEED